MYSAVRLLLTSVLVLSVGAACDEVEPLDEAAAALLGDPVGACPIPGPDAIPGHESDFYLCAERSADSGRGCGDDGYLLGYGTKYSQRFYKVARPRMSARGQRWIDDVLVCLQRDLRDAIDATTSCEDIRTAGFDSHPACYLDSGFCALSPLDIAQVVWTIDARDWQGRDARRQVVHTALGCGQQYARWFGLFFGDVLRGH